ncbi:MAG: hypothetical protein RBG13Loki_2111 [Promethearchaeota archaeon CR_4]|nr:MAG: hypothetical protein RBG13Loki_2111 [Candidatus Lokiarchaeota archaeon CR_4]
MPECKIHGFFSQEEMDVGIGCPKCYENESKEMEVRAIHEETSCQICGQSLPYTEDYSYEGGYEGGYYTRHTISLECGLPDGNWEITEYEHHVCEKCYNEKIEPLFKKSEMKK